MTHKDAQDNVLSSVTYERQASGEPTKITREDGTYTALQYDKALRVTKESFYTAQNLLLDETTYVYDEAGKRIAKVSAVGNQTYTYDKGYQLDSITGTNPEDYAYDTNGRMDLIQRDGQTLDLDHDIYDRLTAVKNLTSSTTTSYVYDGQGHRITATTGGETRKFLVAPVMGGGLDSTDMMTDGSGNLTANYIYGGGSSPFMKLDANGNPVYYLTDGMGSVIGMANQSGQSMVKFNYDSFGNIRNQSGSLADTTGGDFRFQGQWLESGTGIYNFRARDYDSKTGTFLSRDPVDPSGQQPEAMNPYQAMYNNPYVYSDPTGMFSIAELNVSSKIQDILQTYATQQARDFLREQTGKLFSNIALGIIDKMLPGTLAGDSLFDWANEDAATTGGLFESFLQDHLCPLLPKVLSSRLWLTPQLDKTGHVIHPGFNCNSPSSTVGLKLSNPDFLFEEGLPSPVRSKNPQSYLIGDVKLTVSQAHDSMKKPSNQWLAMANHAENYQALPLAAYIAFRWTVNKGFSRDPMYVTTALKDMQRIATNSGVALFVVNISSK